MYHFDLSCKMELPTNQINYLQNDYQKVVIISENLNSSEMLVKKNDAQPLSYGSDFGILSSSTSLLNSEKQISNLAINENTNIKTGLQSDIQIRAP